MALFQQITAKTTGNLLGSTCQGVLTPVPLNFSLTGQDAHVQQTFVVEPADALKFASLPLLSGSVGKKQTLFLLQTDTEVQVRLNSVIDRTYSLPAGGIMMLPGLPEVNHLEFTGIASTNATVFVTKIVGTQTLPVPPGGASPPAPGALRTENLGPATIGQTVFALPSVPTNPLNAVLYVEGIGYISPTFFTISSNSLTWLDVPFTLPAGARVEILYQ